MATVSDIIESFILSTLGTNANVNLSRNDLANHFRCAPSQINYVLTTRFNINRGFVIESQRGGGGFIRVVKIDSTGDEYVKKLIDQTLSQPISHKDATYLVEDLASKNFLQREEAKSLCVALSDKALANPIKMEDKLRANILKNVLVSKLIKKANHS